LDLVQDFLYFVDLDELWLSGDLCQIFSLVSYLDGVVIFELATVVFARLALDDLYELGAVGVKLLHLDNRLILSHGLRVEELRVKNKLTQGDILLKYLPYLRRIPNRVLPPCFIHLACEVGILQNQMLYRIFNFDQVFIL
jgi:hypothetical protein